MKDKHMNLKSSCFRNIFYLGVAAVIGLIIYSLVLPAGKINLQEVPISEIALKVSEGRVSLIEVNQNEVRAELKDGQALKSFKEAGVGLKDYGINFGKNFHKKKKKKHARRLS